MLNLSQLDFGGGRTRQNSGTTRRIRFLAGFTQSSHSATTTQAKYVNFGVLCN